MAVSVVVCPHVDVLYVRTPGEFSGCVCENLIKPAHCAEFMEGKKYINTDLIKRKVWSPGCLHSPHFVKSKLNQMQQQNEMMDGKRQPNSPFFS